MKKERVQSNKLLVAKSMPPLYHTMPGEEFDIKKSEVVNWLLTQDDILQQIFELIRNQSESKKLIKYDSNTRKWQGVDYED